MDSDLEKKSNSEIIAGLKDAVRSERTKTAAVLRLLTEFERRRLVQTTAYSSTFEYVTGELGYSPRSAYKRLRAAQIAKEYPVIYELLEESRLDLSRIVIIAPHLTCENASAVLAKACELRHRELEFYVAGLAPRPIVRDVVRFVSATQPALPAATAACASELSVEPSSVVESAARSPAPLAPKVQALDAHVARLSLTIDAEALRDFDKACGILGFRRSASGAVFGRAMKALLREIDPALRETRPPGKPRSSAVRSRRIPAHVRGEVWKRDEGRCAFRDSAGRRCTGTSGLQIDHILPWSMGGRSDDPDNLRLLCPLHNQGEARRVFGDSKIDSEIEISRQDRRPPRDPPD
ncbi:MAG: HNH endonuclease [Elusimicrobia bacterium]|nr:HNH endonuclease [Elusimicrobiota bacterium]